MICFREAIREAQETEGSMPINKYLTFSWENGNFFPFRLEVLLEWQPAGVILVESSRVASRGARVVAAEVRTPVLESGVQHFCASKKKSRTRCKRAFLPIISSLFYRFAGRCYTK